jgi:sugar/nucleoside kinase (ribokinase family)
MFVVIGTTTADLLIRHRHLSLETGADGFRSGNVTFTDTPARLSVGGNGGISAYVLAALGIPVALCSAVGNDAFGRTLVDWLVARGVNVEGVIRSDTHATSTSVILVSDAARQVVIHHPGANARVRPEDIPDRLLVDADVLLASSYPLLSGMRSGGFTDALAKAHASGAITALDIGPAIGVPAALEEIVPLLPHTQFIFGNTHELGVLAGVDDWEAAATSLLDAGARHVIVKRGAEGASLRGQTAVVDAPGFGVAARCSVGAGDGFDAGFLCGVHRGLPAAQALRLANAVAALVVSGERGVLDAPTWSAVEAFLAGRE